MEPGVADGALNATTAEIAAVRARDQSVNAPGGIPSRVTMGDERISGSVGRSAPSCCSTSGEEEGLRGSSARSCALQRPEWTEPGGPQTNLRHILQTE